ncbi:HAAF factor, partial [Polypterus senegalus]
MSCHLKWHLARSEDKCGPGVWGMKQTAVASGVCSGWTLELPRSATAVWRSCVHRIRSNRKPLKASTAHGDGGPKGSARLVIPLRSADLSGPAHPLFRAHLRSVQHHCCSRPWSRHLWTTAALCWQVAHLLLSQPRRAHVTPLLGIHHNKHEDRLWDLSCKPTFDSYPRCSWSNYVNWFDEEFYYSCPGNSAMSGMYSYHDNKHEDRRYGHLLGG